jgi:hypothetical protein
MDKKASEEVNQKAVEESYLSHLFNSYKQPLFNHHLFLTQITSNMSSQGTKVHLHLPPNPSPHTTNPLLHRNLYSQVVPSAIPTQQHPSNPPPPQQQTTPIPLEQQLYNPLQTQKLAKHLKIGVKKWSLMLVKD